MALVVPRPPEVSHPQVWKARELARAVERVVASGHPSLDAELPGGGWPVGCLVEVLQGDAGRHEWQLVLQGVSDTSGPVVLVGCPHEPFGASLEAQGLPLSRLLRVQSQKPSARLWACEQALRCREVGAVLAWLPQARSPELRRLQLAAAQHDKLLFVFRGLEAAGEASPARLRLQVEGSASLQVKVLKRRGPPVARVLELRSHPERLQALLASRSARPGTLPLSEDRSHVLDRTAAVA